MKMSAKGIALLKKFEGVELTAYRDIVGDSAKNASAQVSWQPHGNHNTGE